MLGEQSARHGEAEAKVREALDAAEAGLRQGNPRDPALVAAVERVKSQLTNLRSGSSLRRQVQDMLRDLQLVSDLENARLQLTAVKRGHFDLELADRLYADAFEKAGLDVEALPVDEAAQRIRESSVAAEVAATLVHWALIRRTFRRPTDTSWKVLLRVAQAADPDEWRIRVRRAIELEDRRTLVELARSEEVSRQTPLSLVLLARILLNTGAFEPAEVLLRQTRHRHPGDFWVNNDLAQTLILARPARWKDAIPFYAAAVASRPDSPGAHLNLGVAFTECGRLGEAIAEFREAIRLKKDYAEAHFNLGNALRDKGDVDGAIAEYREAIRLKKDDAKAHDYLGVALADKGRLDEAIAECQEAIHLKTDYAEGYCHLGNVLSKKGRLDDAITEYRKAIGLKNDYGEAHNDLGIALRDKGLLDEAIAEHKKAILLMPDSAEAHNNFGAALAPKGRLDEAIAEYKEAIRLKPDFAEAHFNLGTDMGRNGRLDEAISALENAIRLKKDFAEAHRNLGLALQLKGRWDEAIGEYKKAIRSKPDFPEPHNDLGVCLYRRGLLDEAIASYRDAIRLKEDIPEAHMNLGLALERKGRLDEAIGEYREAIRFKKDYAKAYYNLGNALDHKRRLDEAIAKYREAIRLKTDYPEAYCNLGLALKKKGQFGQALAAFRTGHELGSKKLGWALPSAQWVREAERLAELDAKLTKVLKGEVKPANVDERLALAQVCQESKGLYRAAFRLYSEAFAEQPKVSEDLQGQHRYNAVCAAALAGCGAGKDADQSDDSERARMRRQALDWLRADLDFYDKQYKAGNVSGMTLLSERLAHAQKDPDFKGVREPLAMLPESEQPDWRKLWADMDQLLKRARASLNTMTLQGNLKDESRQQTHDHKLEAGVAYVIDMRSAVFDTYLKLLDAKGTLLAENDDIASNNLNSRIIFTPKESGTFRIVATSFQERGRGTYSLTITSMKQKKAIGIKPDQAEAHYNRGNALLEKGRLDNAIAEYREAIRIKPDYAEAHKNLGNALSGKGRMDDAMAEYREATRIKPDYAEAHNNVGYLLLNKGRLDEAIAKYREAIRIKPDLAMAHSNLGVALHKKGRLDEAMAEYREAIRIKPDLAMAHSNLGNSLRDKGRLDEAIAACREAIRLKPDFAGAHDNLGNALSDKGLLDEAIAEYRETIRIEPNSASAHSNLGNALRNKSLLDQAIAEYRKAIRINPSFALAQINLGNALRDKGQLTEALACLRRGHELGSNDPRWRYPSAQWVKECELLVEVEAKLPKLLTGEVQPANFGERLALAHICRLPSKSLHAAAVRFYAAVFAEEPNVADDLQLGHRYRAASAAALAGCGEGHDTAKLSGAECAALRKQALERLRADLGAWRRLLDKQPDKARFAVAKQMQRWLRDPDFNGVRSAEALGKLLEAERQAWRKLWADTDQLLKQARGSISQTKLQETLTDKAHQQSHDQQLQAGKEYVIDMTSSAFDTYLKLLDPKGNLVAENDDIAANNRNSRIIYTPKESGTYRIVATSFEERGRGAYTLTITTLKGKAEKKSP
jgi:tetratricopeptide (TPR) repeat protein